MDASIPTSLLVNLLKQGCPGISQATGHHLSEAVLVCFDHHNYPTNTKISLDGITKGSFEVIWSDEVTDQIRNSWQEPKEMVNYGACGIAILIVLTFTKYTVIRQARIGTGIDYWLSEKDNPLPFQDSARLEISGILKGDTTTFNSRVRQKINQTEPTDKTKLPAYIVVVEFSTPMAKMVKK